VCLSIFVVRHLACAAGGEYDEGKSIKDREFLSIFLPSIFAPAHAPAAASGPPAEPPSRLSTLVHDFNTWLNRITGAAANHQAGRHSPPLPRSRPVAEATSMPVASNKEWSEFVSPPKKKPTPIQIND
jgi:hypothetical protein